MSDIKFVCPNCTQHIAAPEEMLGMEIDCPNCANKVMLTQLVKPAKPSEPPKMSAVEATGYIIGVGIVFWRIWLLVGAIATLLYFLFGYDTANQGVENIGRLNMRLCGVIVGATLTITAVIAFIFRKK